MKKLFVLFAVCIAVFAGMLITSFASEKIGDVNDDGKITAADARLVLRHSASLEMLPDSVIPNADADGNGRITAADARLILRVSANLDSFKKKNPTTELTTEKQTSAKPEETTSAKPENTTVVTTEEPTSAKSEETTSVTPEEPPVTPFPCSTEEVLNLYRDEANQFKSTAASYYILDYQQILDTDFDENSVLYNVIKSAFITDKNAAMRYECDFSDYLPLSWSDACCELTDPDVIESASVFESNGKTTVTITLKPETNPVRPYADFAEDEPEYDESSYTCKMFDCRALFYMNMIDIISDVVGVEMSDPSCTYSNCTAILVFDSETHIVESLEHVTDVRVSANVNIDGTVTRKYIDVRSHKIFDDIKYTRINPPYYSIDAEVKTGDDVILPDEVKAMFEDDGTVYIKGSTYGSEIEFAVGTDFVYFVEEVDSYTTIGLFSNKNKSYIIDPIRKTYIEMSDRVAEMIGMEEVPDSFFSDEENNIVDKTSYTYTVDGDIYEKFVFIMEDGSYVEVGCLNGKITYMCIEYQDENIGDVSIFVDEFSTEIPKHMTSPTKGCLRLTPTLFFASLNLSYIIDDLFYPFI